MMLPVLIIFAWLYLRVRPAGKRSRSTVLFDIVIVCIAVLISVLALIWVDDIDIGNANEIWKPVLSIITTFHIFPFILCAGWWLRRRWLEGSK